MISKDWFSCSKIRDAVYLFFGLTAVIQYAYFHESTNKMWKSRVIFPTYPSSCHDMHCQRWRKGEEELHCVFSLYTSEQLLLHKLEAICTGSQLHRRAQSRSAECNRSYYYYYKKFNRLILLIWECLMRYVVLHRFSYGCNVNEGCPTHWLRSGRSD